MTIAVQAKADLEATIGDLEARLEQQRRLNEALQADVEARADQLRDAVHDKSHFEKQLVASTMHNNTLDIQIQTLQTDLTQSRFDAASLRETLTEVEADRRKVFQSLLLH